MNSTGWSQTRLNARSLSAFQYAYRYYQDPRYLPVVGELKPEFILAIGEHLPPLPAATKM